jgi:hypothetical protein
MYPGIVVVMPSSMNCERSCSMIPTSVASSFG